MLRSKNSIKDQVVIFIHLPKSGGVTLQRILEKQYKQENIFNFNGTKFHQSIDEFKNLSKAEYDKIKLLKGHMFFGLHKHFDSPSTYITILRNPVNRIISHYYYVLQEPTHYLHQEVMNHRMSLKDYVCSGISLELDNGQTRLLCGIEDSIEFGKCSKEMLEIAKYNLNYYFSVVGVLESFDETLMLATKKLGWKIPLYVKLNQTKIHYQKQAIDSDTLAYILKFNQLDIELYEYAKKLMKSQIEQQRNNFYRDLAIFQIVNYLYGFSVQAKSLLVNLIRSTSTNI